MDAGVQVTKTEQVTSKDNSGAYVQAVRTTFTVDGNGPFYVDVPVATFTADAVGKLIDDYATHLRQVSALGRK